MFLSSMNFRNWFLSLVNVRVFEALLVAQLLQACIYPIQSGIVIGIGLDIIFQVAWDDKSLFFNQSSCCSPYNVLLFWRVSCSIFTLQYEWASNKNKSRFFPHWNILYIWSGLSLFFSMGENSKKWLTPVLTKLAKPFLFLSFGYLDTS